MTDEKKSKKMIKALNESNLALAETLDSRDAHNNIHVTNDYTEVTNGSFLLRITTPEIDPEDLPKGIPVIDQDIDVVISSSAAKEVKKTIPRAKTLPILEYAFLNPPMEKEKEKIKFTTTDLDIRRDTEVRIESYRYPNVDAVVPKKEATMEIGFNPEYMMKLCKQFKDNGVNVIKLSLYSATEAMKMERENPETGQKLMALLMPCKLS